MNQRIPRHRFFGPIESHAPLSLIGCNFPLSLLTPRRDAPWRERPSRPSANGLSRSGAPLGCATNGFKFTGPPGGFRNRFPPGFSLSLTLPRISGSVRFPRSSSTCPLPLSQSDSMTSPALNFILAACPRTWLPCGMGFLRAAKLLRAHLLAMEPFACDVGVVMSPLRSSRAYAMPSRPRSACPI